VIFFFAILISPSLFFLIILYHKILILSRLFTYGKISKFSVKFLNIFVQFASRTNRRGRVKFLGARPAPSCMEFPSSQLLQLFAAAQKMKI